MAEKSVPKLTTLPTPITEAMPPLRLAVYAEGGVGKTTLALSFPNPLVIDTDGGLEGDAVIGANGEKWRPEKWSDLNALYFWLKQQIEEKGYQTIVLDSIDTLARLVLHEAMAIPTRDRKGNAEDEELISPEQRDYGKVSTALENFLTKLKYLSGFYGVHIVVTSAVREPDPEKGRTKRTFDVQPAVESTLIYWSNVYGELVVTEDSKTKQQSRVLWTNPADTRRKCKTRFAALRPGVKNPTFDKIRDLISEENDSE